MTRITSARSAGAFILCVAAGATLALLAPAYGDPPTNDDIKSATRTSTEPSSVGFDTTEATADPTDGRCVGDHSVWFRFVPTTSHRMRVTTAGSKFDTRLAVFRGPRNDRRLVDCDDDRGPGNSAADSFGVREGERYWIAISSSREPQRGGQAVLTIGRNGTPGAEIDVTGARSGEVSGRFYIDGTITCSTPSEVSLAGAATQRVGDATARGLGRKAIRRCHDEPIEWTIAVDSATGWAFAPGSAFVEVRGRVWDGISVARERMSETVVATNDPLARVAR